MASHPLSAQAERLARAERLMADKAYQPAHALCLEVLTADSGAARAWFLLGVLAADHDNPLKAAELFGRAAALDSLTRLIMIRLLRLCAHAQPARPTAHEDLRIFHRFNELIEAHYLEHWPLARYAQGIGVTQARLNEVCRRIADLPSKRLILERLMQEAKRLLLFTGSSANEICYQLGFKDPAYFSRFFLRYAQMTPGEYRVRQSAIR